MNKKILILSVSIIFVILLAVFIKTNYKNENLGNNIINQSADKLKQNILNIESYKANVKIQIKSNKNTNTYEAAQMYNKESNKYKQEIISPSNIAGTIILYDGKNLKIKNNKLNLSKIYENYKYIESHELSLSAFIEDYNNSKEIKDYEEQDNIILQATIKNNNKYRKIKKLYIDKNTGKPIKMEIQDVSKNTLVYILYNEIELNKIQKEDIN